MLLVIFKKYMDNANNCTFFCNKGGVCVLPHSMVEALRYFEMDTMLSVKERSNLGFPYSVMIIYFSNICQ